MRTTLDIDDDVLAAAKEIARRRRETAGHVLSELARAALTQPRPSCSVEEPKAFYGFRPLPANGRIVTSEQVNRLREDEGV